MPQYRVVLTTKSGRRQRIERRVEAQDIFAAAAKAINSAPRGHEWTARANDNSTRPITGQQESDHA